jgi:hypothetical protein
MLRGLWTMVAVGCTGAVIALSMSMNYSFGYGLGTTELNSRILGALSVAFDGLKGVLPLFIAWQWAERRRLRAALGSIVFGLLVAYGAASAVGFVAENRSAVAGEREVLNARLAEARTDLEAASAERAALPAHGLKAVIEAEVAAAHKERLWDVTNGCTSPANTAAREFCKRLEMKRGELGVAAEDARLHGIMENLKQRIDGLRAQGAGKEADAQAAAMSFTGLSPAEVRWALVWLIAVTIEAISAFGLFVILHDRLPRAAGRTDQPGKPWRLVRRSLVAGSDRMGRLVEEGARGWVK